MTIETSTLLQKVRPLVQRIHDEAERNSRFGETYMNQLDWETIQETECLLAEIDAILGCAS